MNLISVYNFSVRFALYLTIDSHLSVYHRVMKHVESLDSTKEAYELHVASESKC